MNMGITVAADRPPIVKVIRELAVAADHEVSASAVCGSSCCDRRLDVLPRKGDLGTPNAFAPASGIGCKCRAESRTHDGARHHDAVVVVNFDPIVIVTMSNAMRRPGRSSTGARRLATV